MNKNRLPQDLAIDLLKRSQGLIFQVAAVIADKHGIISWGWNHREGNGSIHAEIHAMSRANPKRLCNATIYVVCKGRSSTKLHNARPCNNCMLLIKKRGFMKVIYSDNYSKTEWSEITL